MKYIISIYFIVLLSGCTANIDGVVTHIGGKGIHDHIPSPWVYPDSAFCSWHPDLCIGDNRI